MTEKRSSISIRDLVWGAVWVGTLAMAANHFFSIGFEYYMHIQGLVVGVLTGSLILWLAIDWIKRGKEGDPFANWHVIVHFCFALVLFGLTWLSWWREH